MSINDKYTLKKGKWEADVCPRLGANVIALRYDGRDLLVPLISEEQLDVNPYIQGSPILLPANRTYLGKFSFEGEEYALPINEKRTSSHLHGLVHRKSFDILSVSEDEIALKYENRGECYPFLFDIYAKYTVDESGLSQEFTIKNKGRVNMPYVFCLHTTFVEPDIFTVPVNIRQEHNSIDIPTGKYVPLDEQQKKYLTGLPSRNIYVVGYFKSCGNVATVDDFAYTVSDNFDHWILYNARGERGYICIEPQAGKVNGLNIDDGHKILAPDELVTYTTRFSRR